MDNRAAFEAEYITFRPLKTKAVVQITLEVPIEKAGIVTDVLGWPRPGESKWVAVALLNPANADS